MADDADLHPTLHPDYQIAERVRLQMEMFAQKFRELNEGGQLADILRNPGTLPGARVEQQPEVFTEQYLIEPVLHGLGYRSPTSEEYSAGGAHFIRRPITYRKWNLDSRIISSRMSTTRWCVSWKRKQQTVN